MSYSQSSKKQDRTVSRLRLSTLLCLGVVVIICIRLFMLMIIQHGFYTALAIGSHEMYAQLFPKRGEVFIQDSRTSEEYPIAINKDLFIVYGNTKKIEDDETAEYVAEKLAEVFSYDDERKLEVFLKLNKRDDPYEPLEQKVEEDVVEKIKNLDLPGINFVRKAHRFYPEDSLAAQVNGFVGKDDDGNDIGRYGIEGYWQKELSGKGGFFEGFRSAIGSWIPLAGRSFEEAEDGADLLLTIDRTLQYKACEILNIAREEYEAETASLIVMDPHSGAIRAMCNLPDFDLNIYNKVESASIYNNNSVFTPYEPGSIFKPVTMAAAINEDLLNPNSLYHDTGSIEAGCTKQIKNAGEKIHGTQTMSGVLENSINTGMVYVAEQLGKKKFRRYVEDFGFGIKEGIELDTEVSGTIASLSKNKGDSIDCYAATASFGQGLTATPLQMVTAFSAIANGGDLLKPYVVEEIRYSDGKTEKTQPVKIREVLTTRTASLVSGMLVNVVDSGHATGADVPGYYVAGKTGTAQISGPGGYTDETNHSFVGFAPVDDPAFVMIVKFEKPQRKYSASTAAPTFGKVAKFLLQYYEVPPER
jgi:stage V sporulation protein D (sporulation-specific penicillin-binding protein)